jgi:nucleoid DNA-binding protein
MRVKCDYRTGSKQTYDKYKNTHPESQLTYDDWDRIIQTFMFEFRDYILESGDLATLFWGFGQFTIAKKKPNKFRVDPNGNERINMPVDWKESKRLGKKIYRYNTHTDGWRCKWMWMPVTARFTLKMLFVFKPARASSRKLKDYLNKTSERYLDYYKEIKKK